MDSSPGIPIFMWSSCCNDPNEHAKKNPLWFRAIIEIITFHQNSARLTCGNVFLLKFF